MSIRELHGPVRRRSKGGAEAVGIEFSHINADAIFVRLSAVKAGDLKLELPGRLNLASGGPAAQPDSLTPKHGA